ncbi:MAG: DegV family protein [Eubacteriales bacterium]|nr:DegV family protein [Eubacteriales bacterium]
MEKDYIFMTDSDSDLPYTISEEKQIPVVSMPFTLDDRAYMDDNGRSGIEKQLLDRMRAGSVPSTSLLPTEAYLDIFEPVLREKDLLFLAFSSAMSATIQNIYEAREQLLEKYPERRFTVVDTLSISGTMTLLVLGAHELYEKGASMEEVAQWVTDHRMNAQVWMTVGDLKYLARGGRLSPTSAAFGTILKIKPIICIGRSGKMEAVEKVRGQKKALHTIVEHTARDIEHPENQTAIIMHGDVPDEAAVLAEMLRQRIPELRDVRIQIVGPVIGAHCGPGTLACIFMGRGREN